MLRQVIQCNQRNRDGPLETYSLANFTNETSMYSLTLKKYKKVLKMRKDYLRIIFFPIAF